MQNVKPLLPVLSPKDALKWLEDNMQTHYPLGVYKDKYKEEK